MFTILSKSVSARRLRGFRSLKWESANNLANTPTKTFWRVRTNFRRETFIQWIKLKLLFSEPNEIEFRAFLDLHSVMKDSLFHSAFRAKRLGYPLDVVIERMNTLERFFKMTESTKNLFFSLDGTISYELEEYRTAVRPAVKFTGYVRNISKLGSKKSSQTKQDPEIFEWYRAIEIDFYLYLTVGEFSTGQPGGVFFTLMSTKSTKRTLT